ncbi:zinc finger CCCH domain-containing protein 28-like [Phalaenopsis equestris]|uniref:zinc finger CCCH domain-containing protein 28-like n=1 Tax=Phalaenopsis equestris TaxID=78828 RepID=UPI0009E5B361|nr:zinc finger CCCH domain-containing protein 28-like [Phalaenopsis equestris]
MHNRCFRGRSCRYFHPPPHIHESLRKSIRMEDAKDPVGRRSLSPSPSTGSDDANVSRGKHRRDDLTVEVCKDFIRSGCRRAEIDCKFAHPPSAVRIERGNVIACTDSLRSKCFRGRNCPYFHPPSHIQESLLKAIGMKDTKDPIQSSSQSPSYDSDDAKASHNQHQRHDLSVEVCKEFIRRTCRRPEIDCKFAHPPSTVTIEQDRVVVCIDSLRDKCFRGRTCRYFHPPPQMQASLRKEIGMEDTKDPMALRYLGSSDKLSSYLQPGNDHEIVPVCQDFLKNACNRRSCKYAHPDSSAMGHLRRGLSPVLHSSTLVENGAIPTETLLYPDVIPVCKDFLKNACKRDSCRYFHLIPQSEVYLQQNGTLIKLSRSPPPPETEQKTVSVCRDFLKNACQRDSCKYAHPNSQTKVVDNQVEICRDFHRGICHRDVCRFYHPNIRCAEK